MSLYRLSAIAAIAVAFATSPVSAATPSTPAPSAPAATAAPSIPAPVASIAPHGIPDGADGPAYAGAPDLDAFSGLLAAGDSPDGFSVAAALDALVGKAAAQHELDRLTKLYGSDKVASWRTLFDFAVRHAQTAAITKNLTFPSPTPPSDALLHRIIDLGCDDGVFHASLLFDHLFSRSIHLETMNAADERYGSEADGDLHRLTNRLFFDLSALPGAGAVKLSAFH